MLSVDSNGYADVTVFTTSGDFPTTPGAFQSTSPLGCGEFGTTPDNNPMAFLAKFTATGQAVYSTYLDAPRGSNGSTGDGGATGNGIAADSSGNAYVTGWTNAPQFPTTSGAFQTACTVPAGGVYCSPTPFVTKFNSSGTALLYSTFIHGSGSDSGNAIAVDSAGN